eukprot:TRINITY_DN14406_c0_g1_i1.p1 TRINITY_DN14406_c0_g1~~TRINITY_DN14406_c0_g1_i1.p1  ORF type:complete len:702 (+),score=198.63 TRINITY_DN14406_c0_g1_i1:468-2573(+)
MPSAPPPPSPYPPSPLQPDLGAPAPPRYSPPGGQAAPPPMTLPHASPPVVPPPPGTFYPHAPSGDYEAFLKARALNNELLLLLDDALADASAPQKGGEYRLVKAPVGLDGVIGTPCSNGREEALLSRLPLYAKRRGHMHRLRFCMTDVIDTFLEKVSDAVHSNPVANKLEGFVKAKGQRMLLKAGGAADQAKDTVSAVAGGLGFRKGSGFKPVGAQGPPTSKPGTFDIHEVRIDWTRYPAQPFGAMTLRTHFDHLGNECTGRRKYLDGAGGCVPRVVMDAHYHWDKTCQADPVMFRFKVLPQRLRSAELFLATELGVDPNDLKLTVSIDHSMGCVLRSLPWATGDAILMITDEWYGGRRAVRATARRFGLDVFVITPELPTTDERIRKQVENWLATHPGRGRVKLAILPEVTYQSGIKLRTTKLTDMLHQRRISVFVDGTMAVGHRDLRIGMKHADWYGASLSSWMYCEAGTAILVTSPLKQPCTNTLTVSYFDRGPADQPGFCNSNEKEFSYTGLQDFAPWLSVYQALRFTVHCCTAEQGPGGTSSGTVRDDESGSFAKVRAYTFQLAKRVVELLHRKWGTTPIQQDGDFGAMPVVPLPGGQRGDVRTAAMLTTHFAETPGACVMRIVCLEDVDSVDRVTGRFRGPTLCARFTCQIYNELADYDAAADQVLLAQSSPGYGAVANFVADPQMAERMYHTLA